MFGFMCRNLFNHNQKQPVCAFPTDHEQPSISIETLPSYMFSQKDAVHTTQKTPQAELVDSSKNLEVYLQGLKEELATEKLKRMEAEAKLSELEEKICTKCRIGLKRSDPICIPNARQSSANHVRLEAHSTDEEYMLETGRRNRLRVTVTTARRSLFASDNLID